MNNHFLQRLKNMKKVLISMSFAAFIFSCSARQNDNDSGVMTLNGTIEKRETTSYQYGTHIFNSGDKIYAIKSNSLNLNTYLNKQVSISGSKVKGYPVDGGPELIDVSKVIVR